MSRNTKSDTFDAGQFGTLRYDFKPWGGVQGVIPDPSDELLEEFMKGLRDLAQKYGAEGIDENSSPDEIADALDDVSLVEAQREMCDMLGKLCQESPSAEMLLKLPLRVRQGFARWIQGKLLDPEAGASDSRPAQVRRLGG